MMKVAFEIRGPVDEPYLKVHREHVLAMTLRPGSMEMGLRPSEMRRVTFDAGLMGLCPPQFEQWIGSCDMAHLTMSISKAALIAASDGAGGNVQLRAESELMDLRCVRWLWRWMSNGRQAFQAAAFFWTLSSRHLPSL